MAQYKTHTQFNLLLALPLLVVGMVYFLHPTYLHLLIFSAAFVYATLFMNPDLDLANQIKLLSIRGLLTLPFRAYSSIFRHRGLSHSPFFGTLTRMVWLGIIFLLILFLIDQPVPSRKAVLALLKTPNYLFGLSAIMLADLCHLLLDYKSH
jgi:uncharacterized metal-binding protein